MTFRQATRTGTKALIGLYGGSGSGKTYSALMMARGLVGPSGNVLMIDTESRRGEMYADMIEGGYMVEPMDEPFSSNRYMEIIEQANNMSKDTPTALVVDSMSHEWEGIGGVVDSANDLAEKRADKKGYPWNGEVTFSDWKNPKQEHKKMMLQLLGCNMHVICCLRADYKTLQIPKKDFAKYGIQSNKKSEILQQDFQTPIQDKNFIYEMTVHAELRNKSPGLPNVTKCPEMLRGAFPQGQQISIQTGEFIKEWTEGGAVETKKDLDLFEASKEPASKGMQTYHKWYKSLSKDDQMSITSHTLETGLTIHETRKIEADEADKEKAQ